MAATETGSNVAARTGAEFLEGLRNDKDREIWIGGECVANPMDHEDIAGHMKQYWSLHYKRSNRENESSKNKH